MTVGSDIGQAVRSDDDARWIGSTAFLHAPTGMVVLGTSNGLIDANHAFATLIGRSRQDALRLGLPGLTHPDDREIAAAAVDRLLADPHLRPVSFTKRYLHAEGGAVRCDCTLTAVTGPDGQPSFLVGSITDAARRLADEAGKEAQRRRAAAMTKIYQALVAPEAGDPKVLVKTVARSVATHIGDYCAVLATGPDARHFDVVTAWARDRRFAVAAAAATRAYPVAIRDLARTAQAIRPLEPQVVTVDQPGLIDELPAEFAELNRQWNIHSYSWIPLHLGNRLVGLLAICRYGDSPPLESEDLDLLVAISGQTTLALVNAALAGEQHETTAALHESERHFRAAFDDAPIGMALVSPDGSLERVNRRLCEYLGYPPEELLAAGLRAFLPADDPVTDLRLFRELTDGTRTSYEMERRLTRRDGTDAWMHMTFGAIRDDAGKVVRLIGQSHDITSRRVAEGELERQRHHAELIARLSEALASVGLDQDAVCNTVVETVSNELGDYCVLLLQNGEGTQLHPVSVHHRNPDVAPLISRIEQEQGSDQKTTLSGRTWSTGQPVIVPVVDGEQLRAQLHPDTFARLQQIGGIASVACVPLRVQGSCIGTLSVGRHREGRPFEHRDTAQLEDIASRCAVAITNARLHTDVNEAHERLKIDMEARLAAEAGQRASEERFRRVFDNSPLGIALMSEHDFVYQRVNPSFGAITGYHPDELVGRSFLDITHADDIGVGLKYAQQLRAGERDSYSFEKRYLRKDGSVVWVRLTMSVLQDDQGDEDRTLIATIEDITDRKKATEQLAHLALHDALTGLPNRLLLRDRLGLRLADLARTVDCHLAIFYVDLDRFKDINDSLGHDVGDAVLAEMANRLQDAIRPTDTAARVGGDEFVLVCGGLSSPREAILLAERIEAAVRTPLSLGGHLLHPSASVGVATTERTDNPEELIRRADAAMYRAKRRGGNRHELFDERVAAEVSDRFRAAERIRVAIDEGRFVLHYQPIVELATERVIGAEALLRLDDPERGLLLPLDFLDAAEDSGLIVPLGEWVVREGCRQLAEWQQTIDPHLELAINISGRQINQIDIRRLVLDAVSTSGVDPAGLTLEMTETVLLEAAGNAVENLEALKELGIRLALDDFGTGYSSLSYLKRFPVDIVKIDRSFTKGLGVDRDDTAIVSVITTLGQQLELTVVAEGVETRAQADHLRSFGCHHAQGWLYSKAVSAEAFAQRFGDTIAIQA